MFSRRQKLLNIYARWFQKPALALITPPRLARLTFNLNARTIYKSPKGLTTRALNQNCTICALDNAATHGTILYVHGGAFVIGSLVGYRHLIATLAKETGMRGVYVDYPLAPENPAPAALDAVTDAYVSLLADPDTGPIALVGDSAGGNLVLALLHRIIARDLTRPFAVGALSPVTDLALVNPSLETNQKVDLLVPMSWGLRGITQYLNGANPADPELSPVHGTFTDAGPVLIHTDTTEVLNDDAHNMAKTLRDQGVDVAIRETTGLPHVNHLNLGRSPEADAAVAHISAFLSQHLPAN